MMMIAPWASTSFIFSEKDYCLFPQDRSGIPDRNIRKIDAQIQKFDIFKKNLSHERILHMQR